MILSLPRDLGAVTLTSPGPCLGLECCGGDSALVLKPDKAWGAAMVSLAAVEDTSPLVLSDSSQRGVWSITQSYNGLDWEGP